MSICIFIFSDFFIIVDLIILVAKFRNPSDLRRQVHAGEVSITVRENVRSLHVKSFFFFFQVWNFIQHVLWARNFYIYMILFHLFRYSWFCVGKECWILTYFMASFLSLATRWGIARGEVSLNRSHVSFFLKIIQTWTGPLKSTTLEEDSVWKNLQILQFNSLNSKRRQTLATWRQTLTRSLKYWYTK